MTEQQFKWPKAGDAVRLLVDWLEADAGDRGVIDGMIGATVDASSITFRPRVFRDDVVVSVSGGPGSIITPLDELIATDETVEVKAWRWKNGMPGRDNGVEYTYPAPLWEWIPGKKAPKPDVITKASQEKMLGKIRGLLALAEDPAATAEEAETCTKKAMDLLSKYGIDQAMLADASEEIEVVGDKTVEFDTIYAKDQANAFGWICTELGVRFAIKTRRGCRTWAAVHMFGMPSDLERAELLFTSLLVQYSRAVIEAQPLKSFEISQIMFVKSFLDGFFGRVSRRLRAARLDAEKSTATPTTEHGATGRSVALVLADRADKVSRVFEEAYPNLKRGRTNRRDGAAHYAGQRAGDKADLNTGNRVGQQGKAALPS